MPSDHHNSSSNEEDPGSVKEGSMIKDEVSINLARCLPIRYSPLCPRYEVMRYGENASVREQAKI